MDDFIATDTGVYSPSVSYEQAEEQEDDNVVDDDVNQITNVPIFLNDEVEYPQDGTDQGLVVIFNQLFKGKENYRKGTEQDAKSFCSSLKSLKFIIEERYIFEDKNKDEILEAITTIIEDDHSQRNCVIVAFFTHGDVDDKLLTIRPEDDLKAHEIWRPFVQSEKFKNKPKMFIFQACKGKEASNLHNENNEETFSLVPANIFTSKIGPDMLIAYSTLEDKVSYRNKLKGTPFIQQLCRNFDQYGVSEEVINMIISTSSCVSKFYHIEKQFSVNKQMPIFVSTLKKKFYLKKNEDRPASLAIEKYPDELMKHLEKLLE